MPRRPIISATSPALLSELAAIGYRRFNAAMAVARATGNAPTEKALASARAYVAYAQAHPGMYGLMFRTERLDYSRPSLREAAEASFAGLPARSPPTATSRSQTAALSLDQAAAIARAWSLVHGFTTLLLDGRLIDILRRFAGGHGDPARGVAGDDAHADNDHGRPPGTRVRTPSCSGRVGTEVRVRRAPRRGRAHLGPDPAAFEIARELVGRLACQFIRVGVRRAST